MMSEGECIVHVETNRCRVLSALQSMASQHGWDITTSMGSECVYVHLRRVNAGHVDMLRDVGARSVLVQDSTGLTLLSVRGEEG